jgi:hypothetical protein
VFASRVCFNDCSGIRKLFHNISCNLFYFSALPSSSTALFGQVLLNKLTRSSQSQSQSQAMLATCSIPNGGEKKKTLTAHVILGIALLIITCIQIWASTNMISSEMASEKDKDFVTAPALDAVESSDNGKSALPVRNRTAFPDAEPQTPPSEQIERDERNKESCLQQHVEFDQSLLLAPWDPLMIKSGGDMKLRKQCPDQVEKFCQDVLPLHACLLNNTSNSSTVPSSCPLVEAEKKVSDFHSGMTITEVQQLEKLIYSLDQAAEISNATYWLATGSAIGATLHHSRIPCDDDVAIYV